MLFLSLSFFISILVQSYCIKKEKNWKFRCHVLSQKETAKKCIFKDQELRYSKDINTRLSPSSSSCSYQMRLVSYSTPPPIPLQFSPLLRGYSPALSRTCHDVRLKIKKKNVYPRPLEWQLSVRCLPLFFLRYSDRSRMWGG